MRVTRTSVGLLCLAIDDGTNPPKNFSMQFVLAGNRWTQSEPGSTSDIFKTHSGNFVVVANTTSLKNDGTGAVVATIRNFNPSAASEGDHASDGEALETARIFEWKVEIITE